MEEEIQEHNSSDGSNMSNEEDYYDSDNRPEFL